MNPDMLTPANRASLFVTHLLGGEASSAYRALAQPMRLSPAERQDYVDRWLGDDPDNDTNSTWHSIIDTITNPMVLAGMILAMKYPVKHISRMRVFRDHAQAAATTTMRDAVGLAPFHETFRETPIAPMFDRVVKITHTYKENMSEHVARAIQAYERNTGNLYTDKVGARIVAHLDGLNSAEHGAWRALAAHDRDFAYALKAGRGLPRVQLTAAEAQLAKDLRMNLNVQLNVVENALSEAAVYKNTVASLGQMTHDELSSFAEAGSIPARTSRERAAGRLENYWPHIPRMTEDQVLERYEAWLAGQDPSVKAGIVEKIPYTQTSKQLRQRENLMMPDEAVMREAGLMTPELESAYRRMNDTIGGHPTGRMVPRRRYSLKLLETMENYTRGMARTLAWRGMDSPTSTPFVSGEPLHMILGDRIKAYTDTLARVNPFKAGLLRETYIPLAAGRFTWQQAAPSLRWTAMKQRAADFIQTTPMPASVKKQLMAPLLQPASLSWQKLGNSLQSLLFSATISGNIRSSVLNIFQTGLTTYPVLGARWTGVGIDETMARFRKYLGYRRGGQSPDQAFASAFSEFHETAYDIKDPHYGKFLELVEAEGAERYTLKRGLRGKANKFIDAMTLPFTTSERFNRLVAYYGAYRKGLSELPGTTWTFPDGTTTVLSHARPSVLQNVAKETAERVVRMTQFGGGILGKPRMLLNLWPPLTQFTGFTMNYLNFLLGSSTRLYGAGQRDLGVLGRSLLGAGLTLKAGEHLLGSDLTPYTMFGALPQPSQLSSFYPSPFVPPLLQLGGAAMKGLYTGNYTDLVQSAPLLVPFGVPLSRTVGLIPGGQGAAKFLGRAYVDYSEQRPDGKAPLYTGAGLLRGFYSPMQLLGFGLGFGAAGDPGREAALTQYLRTQRDEIRAYKREALTAIYNGDYEKFQGVQAEYQKRYPDLGPLPLKPSDIRNVHFRKTLPRLELIMQSLPQESRAMFADTIATSLGADAQQIFTSDPRIWGTGSVMQRHAHSVTYGPTPSMEAAVARLRMAHPSAGSTALGLDGSVSSRDSEIQRALQQAQASLRHVMAPAPDNVYAGYLGS